jgi:hypothetical protein
MRPSLWLQAKIDARLMQESLTRQQINEKEQERRGTKLGGIWYVLAWSAEEKET